MSNATTLREVVGELIEWDAHMGGHEAPIWSRARALYRRLTALSVWTVTIEDRYGHATSVFSTQEKARDFAYAYVAERWRNSGPEGDIPAGSPAARQEAIDAFNEHNECFADYDMVIERVEVDKG